MAALPLCLSGPLYDWSQDDSEEPLSFDEIHQRVIHRREKGFSTVDLIQDGGTPDGLFVKFEVEGLRSVRFSPDGLHFAFLCNKRYVGCAETLQPSREHIVLPLRWARSDADVLELLWLTQAPQQQQQQQQPSDQADVAVVTTQGIETFQLSFEQRTARSRKAVPTSVRLCWADPSSGMVLACTGPRTLQPFNLHAKSPKLPKFDLVLGRDQVLNASDVAIMTIYDATYCIHADNVNGRVSLRNVSNPSQGTPDHDIVIDVGEEDGFAGTLRLSKVDNLLIVHALDRQVSMIFDIRHRERQSVPRICGPNRIACAGAAAGSSADDSAAAWSGWTCSAGSAIFDTRARQVFRLSLQMSAVLQHFLVQPHELATVIRFLLRRANCREHLVQTLKNALLAKTPFEDCARGFAVLNQAYRQAIEAVSHQTAGSQGRQGTVSLQELESVIGQQSILSEKDMVSQVFHPHFLHTEGLSREVGDNEAMAFGSDSWQVPLPPLEGSSDSQATGKPARCPYLLSVALSYLRSLLSVQILPHKSLQCFVFDVCMFYRQEQTLQQLLHYHVLLDSPELAMRLRDVAVKHSSAWATQVCFDVALRIHEYALAEMLLHTKQYLDIVPFLMNQREISFEIRHLLERMAADTAAQADDPDLFDHVLSEIRAWKQEAELDPGSQATVWLDWWLDLEEPPITSKWGRFVTSRWFELGCALVIAVNTMVMVYRTDHEAESLTEDRHSELRVLNAVFVILYSMELAAKLSVHRLYFFCNIDMAWNLFDGGLVLLSIIDLIMAEVTVSETLDVNHMRTMRLAMRVLRTTKVLRMFRLIRYFSELRLILNSVVGSFVSLFWSILMLVFMFFIFGLVFVQGATNAQISDTEGVLLPAERDLIRTNLGSTRAAILVLFKSTTGGENWTIFYDMMTLVGHWHAFLFLFFIAFAQFALLNILTGLFVENAMKLAQPDRDTAALQQRKQDMSEADELRSLCMSLDTNRTGYISEELFMQQLNDEQFKARLALLGLDIKHTALFFDVVCSDFKHKQVEIEAFVSAAMRLKGLATSLDLQTLTFGTKLIHENQLKMYSSLEERLAVILECLDKGQLREAGKGTPSFKGGAHVTTMCTMTETEVDASFSL